MDMIAERFAKAVALDPDAVAIDSATRSFTYASLAESAGRLALHLDALESTRLADAPRIVAILTEHSADAVAVIFGSVLSGWAYAPLDPSVDDRELTHMLKLSGACALIADQSNLALARTLSDGVYPVLAVEAVLADPRPQTLAIGSNAEAPRSDGDGSAYVLFTSGSTGHPKPVRHNRARLIRSVDCYCEDTDLACLDRVSLVTPLSFTPSVFCLFGALLTGATLCMFDLGQDDHQGLGDWVTAKDLTLFYTTPTVFRRWATRLPDHEEDQRRVCSQLRMIQLAGEPLLASDVALFQRKFAPSVKLYNGMGTTETSCAARFVIDHTMRFADGCVPIGYAYADTDLIIRNQDGRMLGAGEIGSLHIKTKGVTGEGAEFGTGDLAMRDEGGRVIHFGRGGDRVRIDGIGIDLLEIESMLMRNAAVCEATVLTSDLGEVCELVVFVSLLDEAMDLDRLRGWLAAQLPVQMMPVHWVLVRSFPTLSAGKIDRTALRALVPEGRRKGTPVMHKPDALETYMLDMFRSLLDSPDLDFGADFFASGGDMRLALELTMAIERDHGIGLSVSRLRWASTPINLAHELRRCEASGRWSGGCLSDLDAVWQLDHSAPLVTEPVIVSGVPEPQRSLLDHQESMTATLAKWSGADVALNVLAQRQVGRYFMRKIELVGQPAQTLAIAGIRIDLAAFSPTVRQEIMAGNVPFGKILQTHNILARHKAQGVFITKAGTFGRKNRIEDAAGTVLADVIEVLSSENVRN